MTSPNALSWQLTVRDGAEVVTCCPGLAVGEAVAAAALIGRAYPGLEVNVTRPAVATGTAEAPPAAAEVLPVALTAIVCWMSVSGCPLTAVTAAAALTSAPLTRERYPEPVLSAHDKPVSGDQHPAMSAFALSDADRAALIAERYGTHTEVLLTAQPAPLAALTTGRPVVSALTA